MLKLIRAAFSRLKNDDDSFLIDIYIKSMIIYGISGKNRKNFKITI